MDLGTKLSSATLQSYRDLFEPKESAAVRKVAISTPRNGPSCATEAFRLPIQTIPIATAI